jgi:anaerobic ribonucleoside-triphosphate reductase activating protein
MKLSKKDESVKLLIAHVDVIMDGRFEKDKLVSECKNPNDYPFRGSTNQRAIDVQKSLKSKKVVLFTAFNNK